MAKKHLLQSTFTRIIHTCHSRVDGNPAPIKQTSYQWMVKLAFILSLSMLTGCASLKTDVHRVFLQDEHSKRCYQFYDDLDYTLSWHGVKDASAYRIYGFPYLRTNRLLSSFKRQQPSEKELLDWTSHLHALALESLAVELANLGPQKQQAFTERYLQPDQSIASEMQSCGAQLLAELNQKPQLQERLLKTEKTPNNYSTTKRVLGLYPLTALGIKSGIQDWHSETLDTFADKEKHSNRGVLTSFVPPSPTRYLTLADKQSILNLPCVDTLCIPTVSSTDLQLLFDDHAPIWKIDVHDHNDLPGQPHWKPKYKAAQVDTNQPTVYRFTSHTRWQDKVLLQLNYVIWFKSRPQKHPLDALGGHMDGIIWRVTLAPDGQVLMYDSIHNCGCYHLFFPSHKIQLKEDSPFFQEPAFVPKQAPKRGGNERIVIEIASGSHYIEGVYAGRNPIGKTYQWRDYNSLRSMPHYDGRKRSLFAPDGLVKGTERLEALFFWPMGIPAPGSMRQTGHHATAFVGYRHFDDPDLIESNFVSTTN